MEWIESLGGISSLLEKYGGIIVMAAGFLMLVYQMNKANTKQRERMDIVQDRQQEMWMKFIDENVFKEGNYNHAKEDHRSNTFNLMVDDILTEGIRKSRADRALLFSYHNGGRDYTGRGFQKMSCTNEIVCPGVKTVQAKYNNTFRSVMKYVNNQLIKVGYFNIPDIQTIEFGDKDTDGDAGFYQLAMEDNIHAMYGCHFVNKDGEVMGFVAFTYPEPQTLEESDKIIQILKVTKYKIEGLYHSFDEISKE